MFFTTLLLHAAVAEAGPPPMIDMDWTVLIQFGFFLTLWLVLWRFLFAPYLKMRDQREEGIAGARKKAHDMEESARKMVADYDAAFNRAKLRGAEERQKLRSEAAAHERQVMGAARDESQRALTEARTQITAASGKAKLQLDTQAASMARLAASRILGREVA